MGPFLSAIIAAFLGTLALDSNRTPDSVDRTTATVVAIGMIVFAWVTARMLTQKPGERGRPPAWARPADLILYALLVFETDWITVARESTLDLPFLRHVMVLVPYFLAALARVEAAWPAEQTGDHPWSRSRVVAFHAKLLLIPILPLIVIEGVHDVLQRAEPVAATLQFYPVIDYGVMAVLFVSAVLLMPVILSWLLGSKPMPEGPLRAALEADLLRQGTRIGRIDEVDTGGLIANAAYLGLTTRMGRIFISDALLEAMPHDEIRAVFAHEVAHGTRRHLCWFTALFVSFMLGTYAIEGFLASPWMQGLAIGLPMIGGLFAFVSISRRFEVEADLVGAEALGDPDLFNRALLHVAGIAGKPVERHGMRHFSIGLRTAIVRACAVDPEQREGWARRIRACKIAIAALFAVVFGAVAWKVPQDFGLSAARSELFASDREREEAEVQRRDGKAPPAGEEARRDAAIRERLELVVARARGALDHPAVRTEAARIGVAAQMSLADEALRRGDFDGARAIEADVEANWPVGDPVGDFNRTLLRAQLAAVDPARELPSVRPLADAATKGIEDLLQIYAPNRSSDWVQQELGFLSAAAGTGDFEFDPDSFESARLLALSRRPRLDAAAAREFARALATWPTDSAWRRRVLERALGNRSPAEVMKELVASETRRTER